MQIRGCIKIVFLPIINLAQNQIALPDVSIRNHKSEWINITLHEMTCPT